MKPSVAIGVISNKSVASGKKTTIKPKLVKKGATQVKTATLTVTAGKKTVAKNKASATLGAGTYKVQTKITYRVKSGTKWSKTKASSKTQTLVIKKAKPSAKINTAAGKQEVLARINAKRKAKKLKPLQLASTCQWSAPESLYVIGLSRSGFYYFEGTKWPTAKEWVELWHYSGNPSHEKLHSLERLYKDKKATRIGISYYHPADNKKLNLVEVIACTNPVPSDTKPVPSDLSKADARTRIINGIQRFRSDAKLPALIVSQGKPVLRDGEWNPSSSGTIYPQGTSVKDFLADDDIKEMARNRSYTHVSVSIVKNGSHYEVTAMFYEVAKI